MLQSIKREVAVMIISMSQTICIDPLMPIDRVRIGIYGAPYVVISG
jgi:hypothetical protein